MALAQQKTHYAPQLGFHGPDEPLLGVTDETEHQEKPETESSKVRCFFEFLKTEQYIAISTSTLAFL